MPRKAEMCDRIEALAPGLHTRAMLDRQLNSWLMEEMERLEAENSVQVPTNRIAVAVDPGDVHVGVAVFNAKGCTDAFEMRPGEFLEWLKVGLLSGIIIQVVVEEFRLYAW